MSLAQLRIQTGPLHKDLEDKLQLFKMVVTKEDYVSHLSRLYQWLCPLEETLKPVAHRLPAFDWASRQKSGWIRNDLEALDTPLPPPASPTLPPCVSAAQCLGILYVLEGSTLGSQIIYRRYSEQLQLTPEKGLRYFTGYGPETGEKWKAFVSYLEGIFATHPEWTGEIIESASATFRSYSQFIPVQND